MPCSPPGDLPNSGIKPAFLMSPSLAGGFLTSIATWEAQNVNAEFKKKKGDVQTLHEE